MLARSNLPYTVEEYLALERDSEERHIYLDGYVFDMAGESTEHGTICMNLSRVVSTALLRTPCRAFAKDTKVGSGPGSSKATKGLYSYPDLVVVCGEMKFHDKHRDVLINPIVIIEVLSKSTEAFDRGEKFLRLQTWNPTLIDYLLVSQTSAIIEHFVRQSDGGWSYHKYEGLEQTVQIESINCSLRLAEVFDRIEFRNVTDHQAEEGAAGN
ncbi:MAG TPA: Uma2 family endonuclease [Blastocatellia bacterium]|nr:Uma2 family endonuclease [Blastocatellia bacterium]